MEPLGDLRAFLSKTLTIAELEARKLKHDPWDLFTRVVQPVLWLVVFGQVLAQVKAIPTGDMPYLDFMTPGILAQSVLFISIFYGISIVWERDLGIVQKFLVSPTPRTALVAGKALSAGIRSLSQAFIVFLLAVLLGVHVVLSPASFLTVIIVVLLGATVFATLSLIIACLVKTRERFMGIGQMVTMPLFFASNAIYPISMMPDWLKVISYGNPLTYVVDALRGTMIVGGASEFGILLDVGLLVVMAMILVLIGGRLYPRVGRCRWNTGRWSRYAASLPPRGQVTSIPAVRPQEKNLIPMSMTRMDGATVAAAPITSNAAVLGRPPRWPGPRSRLAPPRWRTYLRRRRRSRRPDEIHADRLVVIAERQRHRTSPLG